MKWDQWRSLSGGGICYYLNEDPVKQRFKKRVFQKKGRAGVKDVGI